MTETRLTEKRKPYEFSDETKKAVVLRSKGICEVQSCEKNGEEFHHVIPASVAASFGLSASNIRSPENCQYLCHGCHIKADSIQLSQEDIAKEIVKRFAD